MLLYFLILGGKKCSGSNPTSGSILCGRAVTIMIYLHLESTECSSLLMPIIIGFLHVEKCALKSFSTLTPFLLYKDSSADHKIIVTITKCLRNSSGVCALSGFFSSSYPKISYFAAQLNKYFDIST